MSSIMQKTLRTLELLSYNPEGLGPREVADALDIPASGAHRLLNELVTLGYVRQEKDRGAYALTTRLISLGLRFMSESGIVDVAQPALDRLARESGELVRLGIIDGKRLTWVAKSQGARNGLIYDPDMGAEAHLASSSSGLAWLMTLSDERALEVAAYQGFASEGAFGPNAPTTVVELLAALERARHLGFALTIETYALGMNGMAAPIRGKGGEAQAVVSVYGPAIRMTEARMLELGEPLLATADELADALKVSPLLRHRG